MKSAFSISQRVCTALALSLSTALLAAQEPAAQQSASPSTLTANASQPNEPTLTLRSQKALESFEPPADEEYTLGAGDEITLDFPGQPELAGKHIIGPDGMITLNLAGAVHVAGLTRATAQKAIVDTLSKYYTDL